MKQLKQKLSLLLTTSSLLGTSFLSTNTINTKINGFHITVKVLNINLVNSINHWNNDSNYLIENIVSNPLNINFASYDQIINNDWNLATNPNNTINEQGYLQTQQRITNNISNFKNAAGFANSDLTAFGHTFNSKNQSVIIPYHEAIKESINQGLFEIINEKSNLNTLMEVPYDLNPTTNFQNNDINMRAKTFPIGPVNNGEDPISNQLFVFLCPHSFSKR
ncbi:hypothetical protein [Spiroplasma endosymbiont of Nebria brevicollis]|uniref:hypothetical protein n=1 Tax=Spiroplasma endosymbiont of Nebria brevicollis TaxID=3066284 RepID=UPI00313AA0EB